MNLGLSTCLEDGQSQKRGGPALTLSPGRIIILANVYRVFPYVGCCANHYGLNHLTVTSLGSRFSYHYPILQKGLLIHWWANSDLNSGVRLQVPCSHAPRPLRLLKVNPSKQQPKMRPLLQSQQGGHVSSITGGESGELGAGGEVGPSDISQAFLTLTRWWGGGV